MKKRFPWRHVVFVVVYLAVSPITFTLAIGAVLIELWTHWLIGLDDWSSRR